MVFRRLASALGLVKPSLPTLRKNVGGLRASSEISGTQQKGGSPPQTGNPTSSQGENSTTPADVHPSVSASSTPSYYPWKKFTQKRVIFSRANEAQFETRPIIIPNIELRNGRTVRVAAVNKYDLDIACRFLEAQFDSEMHFEKGMGASVDDVELNFYHACKRSIRCPFSLIAFEGDQVVGLLLCSSREHRPKHREEPFAVKDDYTDEVETGPFLRRKANRVKAFRDILTKELPYFIQPGTPRVGLVELLVTTSDYSDGQLERIMLCEALNRANLAETKFVGALCATDAHRLAFQESGFTRYLEVPYASFVDRDFRGPKHLSDPGRSEKMILMVAKTDL